MSILDDCKHVHFKKLTTTNINTGQINSQCAFIENLSIEVPPFSNKRLLMNQGDTFVVRSGIELLRITVVGAGGQGGSGGQGGVGSGGICGPSGGGGSSGSPGEVLTNVYNVQDGQVITLNQVGINGIDTKVTIDGPGTFTLTANGGGSGGDGGNSTGSIPGAGGVNPQGNGNNGSDGNLGSACTSTNPGGLGGAAILPPNTTLGWGGAGAQGGPGIPIDFTGPGPEGYNGGPGGVYLEW